MDTSPPEPTRQGDSDSQPADQETQQLRFLSSVSHTLRTPLTAVLGFAEVLQSDTGAMNERERAELLTAIASQAAVMSNTVDNYVAEAQVEMQILGAASVPVNLRAQVAQVVERIRTNTRAALQVEGTATALGDPGHIRHITRNLLLNAEHHGGPNILVRLSDHHDPAILTVTDDGPGIPIEDRQSVFEPFHITHRDESQPGALGLGLSLARRLARLMDGELNYRYESGHSTFTLSLPAHRPNEKKADKG